jgi:hypothetical protein
MSSLIFNLGAINKTTKQYCCPTLANRKEKYICPECNKDLIIKKGEKRIHHFAHYKDNKPCNYYNNPNETQIHKDAKLALKQLLENGIKLKITRKCSACECNIYNWDVPSLECFNIEIEYRFDYNNSLKIADLAVLDKNNIYTIFEIYHSHGTIDDARPEPWFEFDAKHILNNINKTSFNIHCIRKKKCDNCLQKEYMNDLETWLKLYGKEWNGDENVLETIIRKVLGQKEFKICNICNNKRFIQDDISFEECKNCKRPEHLRFSLHVDNYEDNEDNKKIMDIFNLILPYDVIIDTWKGAVYTYIVNKDDAKQYDYYRKTDFDRNIRGFLDISKYPYICKIDYACGYGTIEIIIRNLKTVYHLLPSYGKMTQIELHYYDYENPKIIDYKYITNKKDDNDITDASTYRYMRKEKQKQNEVKSYNTEAILNDNNIKFTENNRVINIIHPYTKEKIRRSMITNKTYFQKEWTTSITLEDIIAWYKSISGTFSKDKLYLQVLFSEKDIVKGLGARWDIDKKKWYISDTTFNREKFSKWIK